MRLSPAGRPSGCDALGLEPGQQPQGLRVALEPADVRQRPRRAPARRCARRAGGRGRARGRRCRRRRRCSRAPRRTRARSGRPRGEWVSRLRTKSSLAGLHDLGLGREPAQARGVHQAGAVAGEVVAVGALVRGVLARPSARGRPRCTSRAITLGGPPPPPLPPRWPPLRRDAVALARDQPAVGAVVDELGHALVPGRLLLGRHHPVGGELAVGGGGDLPEGGGGRVGGELALRTPARARGSRVS